MDKQEEKEIKELLDGFDPTRLIPIDLSKVERKVRPPEKCMKPGERGGYYQYKLSEEECVLCDKNKLYKHLKKHQILNMIKERVKKHQGDE